MKAEQLRKAILQMAIQGKLVPQDPNDEPASVLLERIRAEKQKLIKEGKIKKDKTDSFIFKGDDNCHYEKIGNEVRNIEDEIDFDLPDGWALARISSLFSIQTGASFKKEQATSDSSQTRVLRGGNILQGEYKFFDNDIFINHTLVSKSILLAKNDLITPAVTSIENIGKLALIEQTYSNVTAGGFVVIIRPFFNDITFAKYMLYGLQSTYFNKQLKSITKKSGQAFYNLGKERLLQLIIPIPPIAEQKRIVAEIEKYEPLLAEYDKLEQEKTKLDSEIYDNLKKSILQYAIQGKLVPQNPNDEPASVLLERIRAEKKAKLGKKYVESYIYKGDDNCYYEKVGKNEPIKLDDLPFDIPDSWEWARLYSIVEFENGDRSQNYPVESDYVPFGIPFWGAKDIVNNELAITDSLRYISKEKFDRLNNGKLQDKDIICLLRGTVGKWAIFQTTETIKTGFINAQMVIIRANIIKMIEWLKTYLLSPLFTLLCDKYISGTAVAQMSAKDLSKFLIPVPPQSEQGRICKRIEEMLLNIENSKN